MEQLIRLTKQEQCAKCDICCRFPEEKPNLKPTGFKLVKNNDLFVCEAFDLKTGKCLKYSKRPLDCKIYPFAVAKSPDKENIMLILDNLCPTAKEIYNQKEILKTKIAAKNPIDWEETFIPIKALKNTGINNDILNELTTSDILFFNSFLPGNSELSAFSFAYHFTWEDFFKFYWKIVGGALCVFAKDTDNIFMPLPPLFIKKNQGQPHFSQKSVAVPDFSVFERCFEIMDFYNKGRTESRIENITEEQAIELEKAGFRIVKKDEEYLYERKKLEHLSGDKFKHLRWLINAFKKENNYTFKKYSLKDQNGCADLLFKWLSEKREKAASDNERFLLKNVDKSHKRAFMNFAALGLEGRVVYVNNKVVAYTFGIPLGKNTFCVMFEVSDHEVKGASQYIFMKMAGEFSGYKYFNTMGDEGIESLRANKMHYHPMKTVPEFISYNKGSRT